MNLFEIWFGNRGRAVADFRTYINGRNDRGQTTSNAGR
jgi:hypothetical protein